MRVWEMSADLAKAEVLLLCPSHSVYSQMHTLYLWNYNKYAQLNIKIKLFI